MLPTYTNKMVRFEELTVELGEETGEDKINPLISNLAIPQAKPTSSIHIKESRYGRIKVSRDILFKEGFLNQLIEDDVFSKIIDVLVIPDEFAYWIRGTGTQFNTVELGAIVPEYMLHTDGNKYWIVGFSDEINKDRDQFDKEVLAEIPNAREILTSNKFLDWLMLSDLYDTGKEHFENCNSAAVIEILNKYINYTNEKSVNEIAQQLKNEQRTTAKQECRCGYILFNPELFFQTNIEQHLLDTGMIESIECEERDEMTYRIKLGCYSKYFDKVEEGAKIPTYTPVIKDGQVKEFTRNIEHIKDKVNVASMPDVGIRPYIGSDLTS